MEEKNVYSQELSALTTAMKELLDHSRIQTADIQSMKDDIQSMKRNQSQIQIPTITKQDDMLQSMKDDMRAQTMNMEVTKDDMHSQTVELENMQENMCYQARAISNMQEEIRFLRKKCSVMESLLQQVDTRQQYHQVMLKNNKWEQSPDDSDDHLNLYWASIQDNHSHISDAKRLLQNIKGQTSMMRHGEGSGDVYVIARTHLPYHVAFSNYWSEFASALNDHQYMINLLLEEGPRTSLSLKFHNIELSNDVIRMLAGNLNQTHFKRLELRNNNLRGEGIEFAINYIESNTILESFSLRQNSIKSRLHASRLCRVVGSHPSLSSVSLDWTVEEEVDGYGMLCGLMKAGWNNLKKITFSENDVTTNGNTFFSYLIATNPVLEELWLDMNQFNEQDAMKMAEALKHNTNLRYLSLSDNQIGYFGWAALVKVQFDSTSLNLTADMNHTCIIDGDPMRQPHSISRDTNEFALDGSYCAPSLTRAKKLYSILSTRNRTNSNVQYFDKLPIELLPDMLESIKKYSEYHFGEKTPRKAHNDVKPISIVYEILRKWDEALSAFEYVNK